jgi:hypothetical protein
MKFISPLLSDARASVGGATFSKNRGGNYIRARVAPVQPRTVAQQNVRAGLATLAGMWASLTAAQIAGWNALASGITLSDSLGNSYSPSGIDVFVGNNRNLSDIAESVVSDTPAGSPNFDDISPLTVICTAGTPTFTIAPTIGAAPTGFKFLVRATPQLSPGISYVGQSKYRIVEAFAASAFDSLDILSTYTERFGALLAGRKIQVAVTLVQISSGFQSLQLTAAIIVGA